MFVGKVREGQTVLFQGDSITDAGRFREDTFHLGSGYASLAASWFTAAFPHMNVSFLNRGISGNRIGDLLRRWQEDCIELQPDIVSILIGINDCWRRYDQHDPTTLSDFKNRYRRLLEWTQNDLDVHLVLMEPFVLPIPEDRKQWRDDLDPKIHAVRELAREFNATFVSLDGVFAQAAAQQPMSIWAPDGVHPTMAGHALIAQQWLRALGVAVPY